MDLREQGQLMILALLWRRLLSAASNETPIALLVGLDRAGCVASTAIAIEFDSDDLLRLGLAWVV